MSNEDSRTMWRRTVCAFSSGLVARVARVALCGALLGGVLELAGCTTERNPLSCFDGFCIDPALPFCDVDGTIGGGGRLTCIAVACTPHEFQACRGDEAIVCNATGDNYDVTQCEDGCDAAVGGCGATHIIPRYLPTICDQPAVEPQLTISESVTLDTEFDGICNGGLIEQRSEGVNIGPAICVLRYGTIRIATNKTLTVTGRHALALVADNALMIDGVLDVSANGIKNGPGYGYTSNAFTPNAMCPVAQGGAGFKTRGGPGGIASVDGGAANEGPAATDPALIVPLLGGTRIADAAFPFTVPGGSGGAATLISCRDIVSVVGLIDAGGGGGPGGYKDANCISPGGGGSGGYVALQGMNVSVTGQVFANGGGGGAGGHMISPSNQGADGTRSDTISAQGGMSLNGEGAGGAGGCVLVAPGSGKKPMVAGNGAGAGGGSTGFFQTYTPAGITPTLTPAAASPAFQPNRTIPTRLAPKQRTPR